MGLIELFFNAKSPERQAIARAIIKNEAGQEIVKPRLKDLKVGDCFKRLNVKSDLYEVVSEVFVENDLSVRRCKNRSRKGYKNMSITFEVKKI